MGQPFNVVASGMRPLIQRGTLTKRSSSHIGDFTATSHHLATSSTHLGSFPVRLMLDRWWSNCARFIKKTANKQTRLRPALMVKTDLVDTIGAWHGYQDGEMFLTMNLLIEPVRLGARTDIYRLGVPTV